MIYRQILLVAGLCLTVQSGPAFADQDRNFGIVDRQPEEDPSCEAVNRAYERTANSGTYLLKINRDNEGAQMSPYADSLFIESGMYTRVLQGDWKKHRRPVLTPIADPGLVSSYPIFRSCRFIGQQEATGEIAFRYTANWERRWLLAYSNIWISKESGKFIQTTREFDTTSHHPFGFAKTFETYEYQLEPLKALIEEAQKAAQ